MIQLALSPRRLLPLLACAAALLSGCATGPKTDYTAFRQAHPQSILVLPPINESPDVKATYSFYSLVTYPLAEAGYYVMPVALVDETFKQNGLVNPPEMHQAPPAKLREIFGADAALYITIKQYGATYTILNSAVIVGADAKLVDLSTGTLLWSGSARASNDEGNNNSGGGLLGALVTAVVKQIINSTTDSSHPVAGVTAMRLLSAHPNGMLYGPRSPMYGKDAPN